MKRAGVALGFVLLLRTSSTLAQTAAPAPNPGGMEALVRELRLLREALQRQGKAAARVQLLVARLAQQDQHTARARQLAEELEAKQAGVQRERDELETALREKSRQREQATDQGLTEAIDADLRTIRPRLDGLQRELSGLRVRLVQAKQALEAEAGRNDELERLLMEFDRQLQSTP